MQMTNTVCYLLFNGSTDHVILRSLDVELEVLLKVIEELYLSRKDNVAICQNSNCDKTKQDVVIEEYSICSSFRNLLLYYPGILVQLPLPKHIGEEQVLSEISIEKDVDGFHHLNIGKLAMKGREPLFLPCTPKGCLKLLSRSGINVKGKRAVVVGRSNIVGLPVALLLLKANATVSIVHSRTHDPESIIREADIVIAAAGQVTMIKGDWIKPGAAVIDVWTNSVDDPSRKSGYRLVGDVDFEEVSKVAGWLTPVPGGVGPMTVAILLKNTLDGAKVPNISDTHGANITRFGCLFFDLSLAVHT